MPDTNDENELKFLRDCEDIERDARALVNLMQDDGGRGMLVWHQAVHDVLQRLNKKWFGKENSPR